VSDREGLRLSLFDVHVNSGMIAPEPHTQSIEIEEVSQSSPDSTLAEARELLLEYGRFVIAQPGAARFCFGTLEKEAARLPLSYQEQGGGSLVARVNSKPAGFVAWRSLSAEVASHACELKRLWVRPVARGLGLGRALTQGVLDRAAKAGYTAVYLDTAPASMAAAHNLYLEMGFAPCAPYNDNLVEALEYMMKQL
jgi:putative acetyltransferase